MGTRFKEGERGSRIVRQADQIIAGLFAAEHIKDRALKTGDDTTVADADLLIKESLAKLDSLGSTESVRATVAGAKRTALGLIRTFREAQHPAPSLAAATLYRMPTEHVIARFGKYVPKRV